MKFKFNSKAFLFFILFFLIETFIAVFVRDSFIRPFVGDALVVVLIYFFIKSFLICNNSKLICSVLIFSWLIEIGQYFKLVDILGLGNIKIARIIIGATFDPMDLLAYSSGALFLFVIEKLKKKTS